MNIKDILNNFGEFEFFTQISNDNDVFKELFIKLNEYKKIIKKISIYHSLIADEFIESVKNIEMNLKLGDNVAMYDSLNDFIQKYKEMLYIHDFESNNINMYPKANEHLYKGRIENWSSPIARKDIFHIPFDKRELISTQRYSVYGLPCIYLGQSIHVVWEELNRPSLDNLFISRFNIDKDIVVLDIGLNYFDINELFNNSYKTIKDNNDLIEKFDEQVKKISSEEFQSYIAERFLITGLLKIACSIAVNNSNRKFKSEYVFPQLLMAVITNTKLAHGIRYSSVKLKSDSYIYANYAFPCKQLNENELYSEELRNKIELTIPMNIGIYDTINTTRPSYDFPENLYRMYTYFSVVDEYYLSYQNTKFYNLEKKICQDSKLLFKKF